MKTLLQKPIDLILLIRYNGFRRWEKQGVCIVSYLKEEAMHMLLEQVYLFFIYILFFELAIVTVVVISLFVALDVTIRKLDNEKNTSLLDR